MPSKNDRLGGGLGRTQASTWTFLLMSNLFDCNYSNKVYLWLEDMLRRVEFVLKTSIYSGVNLQDIYIMILSWDDSCLRRR